MFPRGLMNISNIKQIKTLRSKVGEYIIHQGINGFNNKVYSANIDISNIKKRIKITGEKDSDTITINYSECWDAEKHKYKNKTREVIPKLNNINELESIISRVVEEEYLPKVIEIIGIDYFIQRMKKR